MYLCRFTGWNMSIQSFSSTETLNQRTFCSVGIRATKITRSSSLTLASRRSTSTQRTTSTFHTANTRVWRALPDTWASTRISAKVSEVTVLLARLSLTLHLCYSVACLSVICNVCIEAKRCMLPKNCPKKHTGNGLVGIKWSRDWWRHVTLKGQGHDLDLSTFRANISKTARDAI